MMDRVSVRVGTEEVEEQLIAVAGVVGAGGAQSTMGESRLRRRWLPGVMCSAACTLADPVILGGWPQSVRPGRTTDTPPRASTRPSERCN